MTDSSSLHQKLRVCQVVGSAASAVNRAASLRGLILGRNRTGNVVTETPACVPVSPDAAAPAEHSITANAVYLAGPKRIQGTPFWIEAVDVLR
jgi:hypothetical protein